MNIEFRVCKSCEISLPLSDFVSDPNSPSGKKHTCKPCQAEIGRDRNKTNVQLLYKYLKAHPCIDCGTNDPLVLTFDHTGEYTKKANVSDMMGRYIWETVEEEINKCVVRCANCHMKKTATERKTYMYQLLQENNNKNKFFERIKEGLEEAIEYSKETTKQKHEWSLKNWLDKPWLKNK